VLRGLVEVGKHAITVFANSVMVTMG